MQRKIDIRGEFSDLEAGRNPSYLNSVLLGLERGILRAPTSLLTYVGAPLLALLLALMFVGCGLAFWVLVRVYFVVFGLLGLLRSKCDRDDKSVLTSL